MIRYFLWFLVQIRELVYFKPKLEGIIGNILFYGGGERILFQNGKLALELIVT